MQKYWKELQTALVAGIGMFLLAIFLPPRASVIVKCLLEYIASSLLENLKFALVVLTLLFLAHYLWRQPKSPRSNRPKRDKLGLVMLTSSLVTVAVTLLWSLYGDFKTTRKSRPTFTFAGCYTMNTDGVLVEDADAEYLAENIYLELQRRSASHISFKTNLLVLDRMQLPPFLAPLSGQKNLDRYIARRIEREGGISAIYCYRRTGGQQLEFREIHPQVFEEHGDLSTNRMDEDFSTILAHRSNDALPSSAIAGFYVAVMGQSVVESLITERKFRDAHLIVDDSEAMIRQTLGYSNSDIAVKELANYWTADFARLRARLFDEQENFAAAARQLLIAYECDPYFPYHSYAELTLDWLKIYAAEVKALYESNNKLANLDSPEITAKLIDWPFKPNGEWLRQLVARHQDNLELCRVVEIGFRRLIETRKDDPAIWIFWGDIVKILPLGTRQDGRLFIERIPEAREAYLNARKLDPHFPLIPIKLGSLELFGIPEGNLDKYQEMQRQKALETIKDGSDLYLKYFGLEDGPNKNIQTPKSPARN